MLRNGDFKWVTPDVDSSQNSPAKGELPITPQHSQRSQEPLSAKGSSVSPQVSDGLSDWRAYKDPETGAIFWYNRVTNVSQWESPDEHLKAKQTESDHVNEDVVVVQSDADLGLY